MAPNISTQDILPNSHRYNAVSTACTDCCIVTWMLVIQITNNKCPADSTVPTST